MAISEATPSARRGRPGLKREIGFIGLIWASEGSIIGSGWLFGAQGALATAGPAAIISWVIGGVAILILALVHAELGGMYPVSGGTARFPHYAFGGAAGASFGWFSWLQAATVAPIEVLAMITYGQHYSFANGWLKTTGGQHVLTRSGIVVAVILMAIITAINFLSIRMLAHTNSTATWWKVGVPLLTIFVLAIAQFHGSNFTAANGFNPYGAKGILSAVSTSGIIFALLGFEQADQLAGESTNPKRDIPRAVIGSIVIGAIIYILLQVVFIAALPASQIQGTWATAAFTTLTGPFAQVATLLSLGWLATILYLDAVISPAGTGLIYITGSSRVSYGLSRNGYIPSAFERTNRRGVPWLGLLTAFVVANLLILWSGWATDWKLGVAILIGYVILIANRVLKLNPITPQLDLRAAQWLPVYLVGMGLIVYLSDFGPLKHPWFPLWWDMLAVAVFSLIIYFWAMAVALPAAQIQHMIDQVVVPEESEIR